MSAIVPATFDEWRHCIEHDCGIPLSRAFIEKRLMVLRAAQGEETLRFIRHYGETHWQRIVGWFERAQNDIH